MHADIRSKEYWLAAAEKGCTPDGDWLNVTYYLPGTRLPILVKGEASDGTLIAAAFYVGEEPVITPIERESPGLVWEAVTMSEGTMIYAWDMLQPDQPVQHELHIAQF